LVGEGRAEAPGFSFHAPSFGDKNQNLTADNTDDTDLHGSKDSIGHLGS
jgi:hypothetical protein